jgi:ribosomal protein S12 methylthiotransferase
LSEIPAIGFVSLGCPKALVDSERILTRLRAEGYLLTQDYFDADLVVINTCGFIESAIRESLDAIGEALRENGRVIVTGCLGADADKINQEFPEVLAVTGAHAYEEVVAAVHANLPAPHAPLQSLVPAAGLRLTPRHYAYIKVAEGCNHRCSFCVIPHFRGDLVSRPVGEIMQEAEALVAAGVQELLVVAQDTAAYGVDLKSQTGLWSGRPLKTRIVELAAALGSLGVWVRLHYLYPYPVVDQLVELMAEQMQRPAHQAEVVKRIGEWRSVSDQLTIRSSFITGFPGETDEQFNRLLEFVEEAQLDRVGCFTYSPVDGAPANALPGAVPEELKQERMQRLMLMQEEISRARLQCHIGSELDVLVDYVGDDGIIARGRGDAPEIDGVVHLPADVSATAGELLKVRITDTDAHDQWAELVAADN